MNFNFNFCAVLPLQVQRKQSKDIKQRSAVTTLSFTPVGEMFSKCCHVI